MIEVGSSMNRLIPNMAKKSVIRIEKEMTCAERGASLCEVPPGDHTDPYTDPHVSCQSPREDLTEFPYPDEASFRVVKHAAYERSNDAAP